MRAWRLSAAGLALEAVAEPAAKAGWSIIRPSLSGIGASDVRTAQAGSFTGTLGHEFVGTVESIEGEPQGFKPGQRVTAWATSACESCDLCKGGLSAHCRSLAALGQRGLDGCLADLVSVPTSRLLAVPDALADEQAVFAQPLGAAIHASRLVALEAQAYVTVLGDSVLGLLSAQVMARRNATVRMLTEQPKMLELCAKWGLKHRETNLSGLRGDQDVVVECSGTADASAFGMIRPRGSVIQACPPAGEIDLGDAWSSEVQLLCARGCAMAEALGELASGSIQTAGMIGRTLGFEHAADGLALAAKPGSLKIAVRHD